MNERKTATARVERKFMHRKFDEIIEKKYRLVTLRGQFNSIVLSKADFAQVMPTISAT